MFDSLSTSLQKVFKNLRGYGKLSEKNVQDALREVRMALLEADVHYKVAKEFIAKVKEKSLGSEVLDSITPGQQVVKYIHDEMVELLGGEQREFDLSGWPAKVMLLGLHGAGKTTTAGKLARKWITDGKKVLLVGCDIRRPAAVDQLRILAEQAGADFLAPKPGETVEDIALRALSEANRERHHIVLFDTGGRFQIDQELVQELKGLSDVARPDNTVLVLDAAIGQESVEVAETFHREVGLTGLILTKLDGDARGGAALSVQSVTGCPILQVGVGEHAEDLEDFHPDRMASRILGMGDVVTLVEKAQKNLDIEQLQGMEAKLDAKSLNFEDFLAQITQLKKLGPMENLLEMLPGNVKFSALDKTRMAEMSGQEMKRAEAIIHSMTVDERRKPRLLNPSRRRRIARGSGTSVAQVNSLIKRFDQARKMGKKFKKMQKRMSRLGFRP